VSGIFDRLFGGPKAVAADDDPVPGIGGYVWPRGPAGATGYPGSTSARRLNPQLARRHMMAATMAPSATIESQQLARQDTAGEENGGLPRGTLAETGVGPQYQDTEVRSNPVISAHHDGYQQRNTTRPPRQNSGGPASDGQGVNRYAFGGEAGGFESHSVERQIPYTRHGPLPGQHNAKQLRGADLSGTRFTLKPPVFVPQGDGFGKARRSQRNRPTVFAEPAPWSAQFYDTTAATGGPDDPGTPATVRNIHVSPAVQRANNWRRGG
jgi:hypothetical protein